MIKKYGYEFNKKLRDDCYSKAVRLIDDFYDKAFSKDIDVNSINHAKSSILNGLKDNIKYGVYVYHDDELIGLAIYHVSTTDAKAISIDLIDFDPEVRKSFVNKGLFDDNDKPSELLTMVISIISYVGKKNNKNKVKLGLSDKTIGLADTFEQLGFEYEAVELKGTNIYSKRLTKNK